MSAHKQAPPFRRSRGWLALLMLLAIALGLLSRRGYSPFPALLGDYPGDALWAWVVFLGIAWLWPAKPRWWLLAASLAFAWGIEFTQLYQAPWIQALRANRFAYLLLGRGFDPMDLLALAAGIAWAAVLDVAWERGVRGRRHARNRYPQGGTQ